jgi:hypothetical protein
MGAERSETNADLLFISTLSPSAIISGKFVASLVFAMLIFSLFAPFMVFTYLLRGIDIPTIFFVLWMDLLAMLAATMFALFLASIPGPLALRVFAVFSGFVFVFICFCYVFAGSMVIIWAPQEVTTRPEVMWPMIGAVSTLVIANLVLLFFYAVALVSPVSSNRILPIRVTLLLNWVITAVAMFFWSANAATMGLVGPSRIEQLPIVLFLVYNMVVLCVQFVLSTCERDSWGPRVARTIPSNFLLRIPAFLLYTGAAGGVVFTVGLMAATMLLGALGGILFDSGGPADWSTPVVSTLRILGISALYVICYSLSGAVLRYFFFGAQIRNAYTWVITACLIGLGSVLPWMLSIVLYSSSMNNQGVSWWLVPNPFAAAFEFSLDRQWRGGSEEFLLLVGLFLSVWSLVLLFPSLYWVAQQMLRFRPHRRRSVAAAPVPIRAEAAEPVVLTALPVDASAIREEPLPPVPTSPTGADPTAMTPGRAE